MSRKEVLAGAPLLIAHRGGSALAPENTLTAFRSAAVIWAADMIELDVRASADGHCVVIHDDTLERTTNGSGLVSALSVDELKSLDAGYHFTRDGGATHPFRGRGITISTFDEVLEALPRMRFTVEVKTGAAQTPLFAAIERHAAHQRVIAAGMHARDRTEFKDYRGAISASGETMRRFYLLHRLGLARFASTHFDCVHAPEVWGGMRIVTARFVRDLKDHDIPLYVWTVDDPDDMLRLLSWGVEGILSDRPDLLGRVLHEAYGRPLAAGHAAPSQPA
jgi:glycerophosphoryl diester phosphodiesterase